MGSSKELHLKLERKRLAIIEEDFSTRKILATTINTFFENIEAHPFENFNEYINSNLSPHEYKTCSAFLSLKSFYSFQDSPFFETMEFLKNTPTVVMAHAFNKTDLNLLDNFFIEEPIVLTKPFSIKDIINLTEWTTTKSNPRKEPLNGFKKHATRNVDTVVY